MVQGDTGDGRSGERDTDEGSRPSAHALIGGDSRVRALVDRFYDVMDRDPAFAELRALHPTDLAGSRDKLFWFLCGYLGGPNYFVERVGHPMLRARHLPFAIGVRERDQWLACMAIAMNDCAIAPLLRERLAQAFAGTADWMRNRPG
jgi:hemoglobin